MSEKAFEELSSQAAIAEKNPEGKEVKKLTDSFRSRIADLMIKGSSSALSEESKQLLENTFKLLMSPVEGNDFQKIDEEQRRRRVLTQEMESLVSELETNAAKRQALENSETKNPKVNEKAREMSLADFAFQAAKESKQSRDASQRQESEKKKLEDQSSRLIAAIQEIKDSLSEPAKEQELFGRIIKKQNNDQQETYGDEFFGIPMLESQAGEEYEEWPAFEYSDVKTLAKGAFGSVYLARKQGGEKVILKVSQSIPGERNLDNEVQVGEKIENNIPGIIAPQKMWITGKASHGIGGQRVITEQALAPGQDPQEYLESHTETATARVKASIGIVQKLSQSIQQLHERGILHRDIKPENMKIDEPGVPRLFDVGNAVDLEEVEAEELNNSGSPRYMAPEAARLAQLISQKEITAEEMQQALREKILKPSLDIYSLGVTLYEMITGKVAFEENSKKIFQDIQTSNKFQEAELRGQLNTILPEDKKLAKDLATIIAKACAQRPEQRYQSAQEFAEDLERLQKRPQKFSGRFLRSLLGQ